jgi:cardiolipin synthase
MRHRALGRTEAGILAAGGGLLAALGLIARIFPPFLAYPLGLFGVWLGAVLLIRAWKLRNGHQPKSTDYRPGA